jgi:hypothetical protein
MLLKLILVLTNLVIISGAYATTFEPVPLDKLAHHADAVIIGDFLHSKTITLEDGLVATEALFKIEKELGVEAEEFGLSEVKVYYPGGVDGLSALRVEGAPEFTPGQKSALLLTQHTDGRLWIQGMALGTFKVVRIGQKTLLVNSVFPTHNDLSNIEIGQFQRKISSIKDKPFREIFSDKYYNELKKSKTSFVPQNSGNSRSIASRADTPENNKDSNVMSSFWLLAVLGLMGVLKKWWSLKDQN